MGEQIDFAAIVKMLGEVAPGQCLLADFNQDGVVDQTDVANAILFEFIGSEP